MAGRRRADALLGEAEAGPVAEPAGVSVGVPVGEEATGAVARAALRERLPLWFQLRCALEPKATAALGVVLAGLAVLAGVHFWTAGPEPVRVPEAVRAAAEVSALPRTEIVGGLSLSASPSSPPRPSAAVAPDAVAADRIVVDVNGKVRRPGVQHLRAGSRVADALQAAGGVLAGTDITGLNRARILNDGEQVVVGIPMAPPPPGAVGGPGAGGGGAAQTGPLSLGSATAEQLETLPGVGPVLAQHIVDYRTEHGGYGSVDELRQVTGIGDRRFADLQPLVRP
ncbi:helix-hairpin-helix domain-containing protein [Streptomyces sp. NPDC001493]